MYSLEQRTDAIQLFIESGFNENAVIRSLGYPSPTMTIDCLDRDTIRRYRQRMDNLRPGHVWSELAVEDFLHRIGAMARDTDGKLRPTAAGLLMFGHEYEIVREFPHYFLDYQEHDRSVTEDERWTDRIVSSSGDWSGNICDFYFRVYNRIAPVIVVGVNQGVCQSLAQSLMQRGVINAVSTIQFERNFYVLRNAVINAEIKVTDITTPIA